MVVGVSSEDGRMEVMTGQHKQMKTNAPIANIKILRVLFLLGLAEAVIFNFSFRF